MLITLLKLKCVRKSEELKVQGRKRSGWKMITTTFNESDCNILTKCRRWKFMNLICTWYDMESCLRGRSQRKWHIYSTYRWQDLIRHCGERDFVKKLNFGPRKWWRGKDCRLWSIVNIIERIERYKWQPCTAYSGHINVKVRPKENTGRPASETVTCRGRTRRKKKERKKEWMNLMNELQ